MSFFVVMTLFHLWNVPGDALAAPESASGLDHSLIKAPSQVDIVQVWPVIAAWFNMEVGPPIKTPLQMMMETPDKPKLWNEIVKKFDLHNIPYNKVRPNSRIQKVWSEASNLIVCH